MIKQRNRTRQPNPKHPLLAQKKHKHRQRNTEPQTSTLETAHYGQLRPQNKHPHTLENIQWFSTQKTSTNTKHLHHL